MAISKKDKKNPKAKKTTLKMQAEEQRKTPTMSGHNHNETLLR